MNVKRCGNCGKTLMTRQPVNAVHWKDFRNLELLTPIELFKCSACNEVGLMGSDASKIDTAATETLQKVTAHLIEKILLEQHCTQAELALRLGVTETHLSHLKNGTKIIGFQTFNFLKTLALVSDAFEKASPSLPLKRMMA